MIYEEALKKLHEIKLALTSDMEFGSLEELAKNVVHVSDVDIIIEALEKQIPQKPKPHEDNELSARCPWCYKEVETHRIHGGIAYCPECGQAIDWND